MIGVILVFSGEGLDQLRSAASVVIVRIHQGSRQYEFYRHGTVSLFCMFDEPSFFVTYERAFLCGCIFSYLLTHTRMELTLIRDCGYANKVYQTN